MAQKKNGGLGDALGYGGPIFTWGCKAFDLMMLSVCWLIGSLPIVTVGVSSAALYYAVERSVIEDRGGAWECFKRSYRQNLKMGIIHWILSVGLGFLFLLNFGIARSKFGGNVAIFFCVLYGILFAVVVMTCAYLYPGISRFAMPFGWYIKTSLYCVFRYFHCSLALLSLLAIGYYGVLKFPLLIIVVPGMYTYLATIFVEPRLVMLAKDDSISSADAISSEGE